MSLKKEAPSSVTILQAIIFLQFGLCFSITVLTTVGIAFGYPVASHYLMALLQVLVAIPGIVYIALQGNIWIALYISFQLVTAACEIYWLVYMIFDQQSAGAWLGLACITFVNIIAVVVAIWFRQTVLKVPCRKNKNKGVLEVENKKPDMKVPSTSMSDVEKSKAPTKSTSTSSIKKSPARSTEASEKSSKGSLKVRKSKKSTSTSMPLDSRETTSLSRSSSKTVDFSEK